MKTKRGLFESESEYKQRLETEANKQIIESSSGQKPSKGLFESETEYQQRLKTEANKQIIESSSGERPSKRLFESESDYKQRLKTEADKQIIESSSGQRLSKGVFESESDYKQRLETEANKQIIESSSGEKPSKGLFESDLEYKQRLKTEANKQILESSNSKSSYKQRSSSFSMGGFSSSSSSDAGWGTVVFAIAALIFLGIISLGQKIFFNDFVRRNSFILLIPINIGYIYFLLYSNIKVSDDALLTITMIYAGLTVLLPTISFSNTNNTTNAY